jgi:hypothetical protein
MAVEGRFSRDSACPSGRCEVLDHLAASEIDVEEAVRRLKEKP